MKKFKLFILSIGIAFLLIGCFSDYEGQGTLTIDLNSTGISSSDGSEFPDGLIYYIELTNGPGRNIKLENISADDPVQYITLIPGKWTITIKVYYADGKTLYAEGTKVIDIKAGNNGLKDIIVYVKSMLSYSPKTIVLTPMHTETYSENTDTIKVFIKGLKEGDTAVIKLSEEIPGVISLDNPVIDKNGQYTIKFTYNGNAVDAEAVTCKLLMEIFSENENVYDNLTNLPDLTISVCDGINNPIPLRQDNISAFNEYSNTAAGLGKNFVLTEDIDLAGVEWIPNGTYTLDDNNLEFSNPFTGSFDGGNFTVKNLTINRSNISGQGFFGFVGTNGTVKNLKLIDINITGDRQVGGIAGHNEGTIENCFVQSGSITGTATVGGIAGHNGSSTGAGIINRSGNMGCVITAVGVNPGDNFYADAGGVTGYNSAVVSNSYNQGKVNSTHLSGRNAGGVVGYNENARARIEFTYNTGEVTGKASFVGGIVGWNSSGTANNNVSLGVSVTGTADVGRVIGSNTVANGNPGTSVNNYARSNMTGFITKDGADITSANWTNAVWWTSLGFTDSWWTQDRLPLDLP